MHGEMAEWLKAADCKSADIVYVGSNPTLTTRGYRAFYLRVTFDPAEAYGLLYGLPFRKKDIKK